MKKITVLSSNEDNIKALIKVIIPVLVGILIAMSINNWNENRKDRKYFEQISFSIEKESSETTEDIIDTIVFQKSFINFLDI
ncbi:DUF6090 family protein [Cellulophaga algicola]